MLKELLKIARHNLTVEGKFRVAREALLNSGGLTEHEKKLLRSVSLKVHHADAMYLGKPEHYLSVGLSASRAITEAIKRYNEDFIPQNILDLPCGYGRVLRFLRVMFPDSTVTAAEINTKYIDFCTKKFSAVPLVSKENLRELKLPHKYDLIWCGSLCTHLNLDKTSQLIKFFHDHLADNGICIFTTHGEFSIEQLKSGMARYRLTDDSKKSIVEQYETSGYGYADYPYTTGYGISVVTYDKMSDIAQKASNWNELLFKQKGWDNHQDIYAYSK